MPTLLQDIARRGQYFPFDNLAQSTSGVFRSGNIPDDPLDESVDLVLAQYKNSSLLTGVLRSILFPTIELEQIIKTDMPRQFGIQNAFGVWLDILGDYVGEDRNGLDDDEYRQNITFRIFLNKSSGTGDEVIAFVLNYLPGCDVEFFNEFPAKIHLNITYNRPIPLNFIKRVEQVALGGVKVTGTQITDAPYFGFNSEGGTQKPDTIEGFQERGVPGVAGKFVERIRRE